MIDVYLGVDRWSAVEEVAHEVDRWADCSDDGREPSQSGTTGRYNAVDEYVCSAKRRNAIGEYRRAVLGWCRKDIWPLFGLKIP